MALPSLLYTNAFTGTLDSGSPLGAQAGKWIGSGIDVPPKPLSTRGPLAKVPDLKQWADTDVGWGLVLPENPKLSFEQQATADDAPEPIRQLLQYRKGIVLRWSPSLPVRKIRRYYADQDPNDPDVALAPRGRAVGQIPRYLLIYAPPSVIPWHVQYRWNAVAFTGRLDLEGDELKHYVDAVVSGWAGSGAVPERSVTWAVDHGGADITHLMRAVVAKKLVTSLQSNLALGANAMFLDGGAAPVTGTDLIGALETARPALVVTSSHGMTGPLNDVPLMRTQLGIPVDANQNLLDAELLLKRWSPDGAIWYSHACCSAGSDDQTSFTGLVESGSFAEQVIAGVVECGALTAPLPRALLGASRPLRAFIGHVEPTFDWTLRDPTTGQVLTSPLVDALHQRLYSQMPVGYAFNELYNKAAQLDSIYQGARKRFGTGEDTLAEALACRLVAQDIENLVILGDPAEVLF